MARCGRLELGDNILRTFQVYLQPLWRNWPAKQSNSVKKRKIRAITRSRSFKVIKVGINQKPVCDFLLVINSNWYPISYRFGVIAAYCSNFGHFAFLSHPLGDLGETYDVHLGLIGKRIVNFLLVLIELFFARCYGWGTTSDYRFKIGNFAPTGAALPIISGRRGRPRQPFFFSKTRLNGLSHGIKTEQIFLLYCHNSRVWRTDGRTDGQTDRRIDGQNSHR